MEIEVYVDEGVPEGSERELLACLAEMGLPAAAPTREVPSHRGALAGLEWGVLLILPIHALLTGIGASLGKDLYDRTVRALRGLVDRRPKALVFMDIDSGAKVIVDRDLPDDAYLWLRHLTLEPGSNYRYDRQQGTWRATEDS